MILGQSVILRHTGILWHKVVGYTKVVLGQSLDCQYYYVILGYFDTRLRGVLADPGTILGLSVVLCHTGIYILWHKVVGCTKVVLGRSLDCQCYYVILGYSDTRLWGVLANPGTILGLSVILRHTGVLWHKVVGCTKVVLGQFLDCQCYYVIWGHSDTRL